MSEPWTTTYRQARMAGATEWELRTGLWEHPYWGQVRSGGVDPDDPDVRIGDAIALMSRSDLLTGWAAARGHGVAHADGRDRFYRPVPVAVISAGRGQHRRQDGLQPTRRSVHEHEVTVIESVGAATLTRAAYDMALDAPSLCEALVAVEMCVSTVIEQGRTTLGNLAGLIDQHQKTRGIVQTRQALAMASTRSASPWESRTRYVAEVVGGLTGLEVNVPIFDHAGRLAGIADLLDRGVGLVIESDGSGHREEASHAGDNVREEGFEVLNLVVSRVGAIDHRDEAALVIRLQQARLHAMMRRAEPLWTTDKPDWWWRWPPGRRWD
ncbi:hypothetical protein [Aeromicrobium sp.]|uniref:hypothetical protein n=1 Tax=Aeromicrobium sp. TaxID=1871063 RepID=UPI0030BA47E5